MNEQIKGLVKASGLKVESLMTNPPKAFQIIGSAEEFETFVELIVLECRDIIYDNSPTDNLSFELYCAIKDHFGIE